MAGRFSTSNRALDAGGVATRSLLEEILTRYVNASVTCVDGSAEMVRIA